MITHIFLLISRAVGLTIFFPLLLPHFLAGPIRDFLKQPNRITSEGGASGGFPFEGFLLFLINFLTQPKLLTMISFYRSEA
jgi:hypothetical protein